MLTAISCSKQQAMLPLTAALPRLTYSLATPLIRGSGSSIGYRVIHSSSGTRSRSLFSTPLSNSHRHFIQSRSPSFDLQLSRSFSHRAHSLYQQQQLANRESSKNDKSNRSSDVQQLRHGSYSPITYTTSTSTPETSTIPQTSSIPSSTSASTTPLPAATQATPSSPAASLSPSDTSAIASSASDAVVVATPSRYERIMARVKHEIQHYWNGTKLLAAEIRVAASLLRQVLNGHELNRRERKQLTRTSADLLRLIPFAVIVIVPFMEFALPVLLKLFPNMLPSTYLDHKGEEAKVKKNLAAKIEMARFLQDTTVLMAAQLLEKNAASATSSAGAIDASKSVDPAADERRMTVSNFNALMNKVKRGESVQNEDILAVSRLFDEDFTLENLNHDQLAAMCRLLDIRVFGSDWVLRYKLNQAMDKIRADDRAIEKEGVDSLTPSELREACRARGIHSGQSEEYMKRKLSDWLILSLHRDVPISLLVLSRAFSAHLADRQLAEDLAVTLKHIPDAVVEDTQHTIVDVSGDAAAKLELIQKEASEVQSEKKSKIAADSGTGAKKREIMHADVVGLTEIKSKLEEIKEDNDEIEHDIDTHVITEVKQPSATASPVADTGVKVVPVVDADAEVKRVKIVDRLNDRVELLLNQVQKELQEHEQTHTQSGSSSPSTSTTPSVNAAKNKNNP